MAMAVSSQQSRDAALLRATTELFVLDKTHDQTGIRRFEELAAHFLTKVSSADRAFVAERLARHPDTPGSILRLLGKDLPEIASPILRHAPGLNSFDLLAIMAATGPAHYRMIASRPNLARDIVGALRMTGDTETIALLPALADDEPQSPRIAEPVPTFEDKDIVLPSPERTQPAASPAEAAPAEMAAEAPLPVAEMLAPALPEPTHLPAQKAAKPLSALAAARVLTASLSAEMAALSTETRPAASSHEPQMAAQPVVEEPLAPAAEGAIDAPTLMTREAPAEPEAPASSEQMAAQQPDIEAGFVPGADPTGDFLRLERADRLALITALSPTPRTTPRLSTIQIDHAFRAALGRARLPMLARQHQREALIAALAEGLQLDVEQVTALLDDPSGEALVILLKAIGLSDSEAQQVLLFANPVIRDAVEAFFRLTELMGRVAQPAASRLVGQWRGDIEAEPAHHPHFADVERKDTRPAAAERRGTAEPSVRVEKIA